MKIEIEELYGIRNKIEINISGKRSIIFAPNGVGKTSIAKGFAASRNKHFNESIEGSVNESAIKIDGVNILDLNREITVINEEWLNYVISENDDVIRGLIENREPKSGFLPNNLYGDYLDIYNDCISALEDNGLSYNPITFVKNNVRPISEIKKYVNDNDLKIEGVSSSKEIIDEIDKLTNAITAIEKVQASPRKIADFKEATKKVAEIASKEFMFGVEEDFQIISLIKEKDRLKSFRYVDEQGTIFTIDEAYKLIEEKFAKNGVSSEYLEAVSSYSYICKAVNAKPNKTARSQIESATKLIEKNKKVALKFELVKVQELFDKAEVEIIKKQEEFVREYNKEIDELNREILMMNHLKWKIKINHIKNYYDETTVLVQNGTETSEVQSLRNFASAGQKKILALILAIIHAEKSGLIVFDDPISSLDEDNVGIFVQKVISIKNEFIILTHNYRLLTAISAADKIESFVLEADEDNNAYISSVSAKNALKIPRWFNEKAHNDQNRVLFFATVVREVIDNYIKSGYKKGEQNSKIINELIDLKELLENSYRHYKTNGKTFKQSKDEILAIVSSDVKDMLTDRDNGARILFEFESDEVISNYVLNYESKLLFESLLDYTSSKYVQALSIRFEFEKEVLSIESNTRENDENAWNTSKTRGISNHPSFRMMSKQKIAIFNTTQFLNHVNNLRWTPVIETPIYKIQMYKKELKNN